MNTLIRRFPCTVCTVGIFEYISMGGVNELNGYFKCSNKFCSTNLPGSDMNEWFLYGDYHKILSALKFQYMQTHPQQPVKSIWKHLKAFVDDF